MVLRIRHPHTPPKDIDLGPHGYGHRQPYDAMRREIDAAIAFAAVRGHTIAKPKP